MTDWLILIAFLILGGYMTIYLGRRGLKGIREQKIVSERDGRIFTGKEALSVARIYLFFAGILLCCFGLFLVVFIAKIIHAFR